MISYGRCIHWYCAVCCNIWNCCTRYLVTGLFLGFGCLMWLLIYGVRVGSSQGLVWRLDRLGWSILGIWIKRCRYYSIWYTTCIYFYVFWSLTDPYWQVWTAKIPPNSSNPHWHTQHAAHRAYYWILSKPAWYDQFPQWPI